MVILLHPISWCRTVSNNPPSGRWPKGSTIKDQYILRIGPIKISWTELYSYECCWACVESASYITTSTQSVFHLFHIFPFVCCFVHRRKDFCIFIADMSLTVMEMQQVQNFQMFNQHSVLYFQHSIQIFIERFFLILPGLVTSWISYRVKGFSRFICSRNMFTPIFPINTLCRS